ncbi:sulfatase-like hydrolase/transferase [Bacteroidota bacterium]
MRLFLTLSLLIVIGALASFSPSWEQTYITIDFSVDSKVRPKKDPYRLTITDPGDASPTVSTTDPSGDIPVLTGSINGKAADELSFVLTIEGRSDEVSSWTADTWSGGTPHVLKGSETGLGLDDAVGANKLDGSEAIIWSFDLSSLKLDPEESLIMTAADFGGNEEGEHAEFWELTGSAGSTGAGKMIATGGIWTGVIPISDGQEFALRRNGRLRSLTLGISSKDFKPSSQILKTSSGSTNGTSSGATSGTSSETSSGISSIISYETYGTRSGSRQAPNIMMIMSDDMAWYDTPVRMDESLENSAQEIMRSLEDPLNPGQPYKWHLQKMAEEGMIFSNAYSGAPQCMPTRASLQTGMTAARNRLSVTLGGKGIGEFNEKPELVNFPVLPSGVRLPMPDDIITIPEALAPMGYKCAHFGKWHLGSDPVVEGYIASDGQTDNNQGKTYDSKAATIPTDFENAKRIKEITDKTISFMIQQKYAGNPFYIQLSHYAVHARWECKRSSRALFQNHPDVIAYNRGEADPAKLNRKNDPAVFFGMIYELDLSIGRLLKELENLGLSDNTYVIFKSDNGYRRFDTQNFMQPFYGRKWFLWQGGLRVPMIVKGPGIPAGAINTANVVTYDLLPTFFEWAGGNPSELKDVDGISLKGILEGETPTREFLNRSLYFHYPHYRAAIPLSVVVKGHYKLVYSYDATIRTDISVSDPKILFNLETDPGEFHNITSDNPELAAKLFTDLDQYLKSVDAWRPRDNSAAYIKDGGTDFEADDSADRRDLFPPFEGSRAPNKKLNDAPKSYFDPNK